MRHVWRTLCSPHVKWPLCLQVIKLKSCTTGNQPYIHNHIILSLVINLTPWYRIASINNKDTDIYYVNKQIGHMPCLRSLDTGHHL